MVKINNGSSAFPAVCFIDSDVIINWLAQESDPVSNNPLWEAPHKIIKLIETKKIAGYTTLLNMLEIRFVLRRKKGLTDRRINEDIDKLISLLKIAIPDEIVLLEANNLQIHIPFSPFDAILVAAGISLENAVLLSRDKNLITLANKFLPAMTPENFLSRYSSLLT